MPRCDVLISASSQHPGCHNLPVEQVSQETPANQPQDWTDIKKLVQPWYCVQGLSLCYIFKLLVEMHRAVVSLPALSSRIQAWGWSPPEPPSESELAAMSASQRLMIKRGTFAVLRLERPTGLLKVDVVEKDGVRELLGKARTAAGGSGGGGQNPPRKTLAGSSSSSGPRPVSPAGEKSTPSRKGTGDSGYASTGGRREDGSRKKKKKAPRHRNRERDQLPAVVGGGVVYPSEAMSRLRISGDGRAAAGTGTVGRPRSNGGRA